MWILQGDQIVGTCYESRRKDFEHRIRQQIEIDDMQFGFMKGKGTTDAIFMARQMQENFLELKVRNSILVLWIWRKLLIGCQEK